MKKIINHITCSDDWCNIQFEDGSSLQIIDDASYCCENRYITCDDDLDKFKGAEFIGLKMGVCMYDEGEYESHEEQFTHVNTDRGSLVLCSHNEHNGYYSGFSIRATLQEANGKTTAYPVSEM